MVAYALSAIAFGGDHMGRIFYGMLAVVFVFMMAVGIMDRWIGKQNPDGAFARRLEAVEERLYTLQGFPVIGPAMLTLFSNIPHRVILPLFYAIFFGLLIGVMGEFFVRQGAIRIDSSAYIPAFPHSRGRRRAGDGPRLLRKPVGEWSLPSADPTVDPERHDPRSVRAAVHSLPAGAAQPSGNARK